MMKPQSLGRFLLLAGCLSATSMWASILDDLNASQKETVKSGKQLLITEEIAGKPWPKVIVYQVVNATPEEVAAVFTDYDNAKLYTPNILKSEVVQKISTKVKDIDYGVDIPILPDEYYTARNTLSSPQKDTYRIEWKLLRAVQTKDSEGVLVIEPHGDKAVMCYRNLVTPGSGMAGLLRRKAVSQMCDVVTALAARVEKEKTSDPDLLARQVKDLRKDLGQ